MEKYSREWLTARSAQYRKDYPEKTKAYRIAYAQRLRLKVIEAYGGKCNCCGESELKFLCFDHINNDGAAHRKEVGSGVNMMQWIKRNNFPDSIQLLCYNCNNAKYIYGSCPHQKIP